MNKAKPIFVSAILPAAGLGLRFGGERPKQLADLGGQPILTRTLMVFQHCPLIDEIILVVPEDWRKAIEDEALKPYGLTKVAIVAGGPTRAASVRRGLNASQGELVLIHDGVRPFVEEAQIEAVINAARSHGAAILAVPPDDTLKEVENGFIKRTIDRRKIWRAQTPQAFRREILKEALEAAPGDLEATDDAALVEALGKPVAVITGTRQNFKITAKTDHVMAEKLISALPSLKVGQGYDLHRLEPGRPLFLGCLEIPFEMGLMGHSDADVLAHALADALLGAAGLGDIGLHFPDKNPQWAGLSGTEILRMTMAKVREAGFELVNGDLTLIGEKPKIAPYRVAMCEAVAKALKVEPSQISIKATTTEGLDAVGQGRALAATAVVLLASQAV